MAYSRTSHASHPPGTAQKKRTKPEDDPDAFMRLTDAEIAGCISDIGVPFSESDLKKPVPSQIQMVFEHLGEILMNATREAIDPAMRAAHEDVCWSGERQELQGQEIVGVDTRLMMGFFVSLRRMLFECGVHDFSMSDLTRPTYERLGKIFSYVINFIRFREGQTECVDRNYNRGEEIKGRIEHLYVENQDLEQRLEEMRKERIRMEGQVKEKMRRNEELKSRLLELRKGQERIAEQLERSKGEKNRAQAVLEEKMERLVRGRQEIEKLTPYVQMSVAELQGELQELNENLQREKRHIDDLERRGRALQTSSDSFAVVQSDVQACVKVLEEIQAEMAREEEEDAKANKNKEALGERSASVREIEQNEKQLQKQLAKWEEKIEELRKRHKEREDSNKTKMEELWEMQRQLREERTTRGREMDRRRGRIDQTEKKMADLKEQIEKEVHSTHEEYLRLEAHIKLYITEMEQCIT